MWPNNNSKSNKQQLTSYNHTNFHLNHNRTAMIHFAQRLSQGDEIGNVQRERERDTEIERETDRETLRCHHQQLWCGSCATHGQTLDEPSSSSSHDSKLSQPAILALTHDFHVHPDLAIVSITEHYFVLEE